MDGLRIGAGWLAATLLSWPLVACAGDYVQIDCAVPGNRIQISYVPAKWDDPVPRGKSYIDLDSLTIAKPLPNDDGVLVPAFDFVRNCPLGDAHYRVSIHPHVFGSHVLGRCGADGAGAELTVLRNGTRLLDHLLMVDTCGDTGTSGLDIERITVLEDSRRMQFHARLGTAAWEPTFDFAQTPSLTLEKVWAGRPK